MGKKAVQLDKTSKFPGRFMTLCSTEGRSLDEWGDIFSVTRQTISNWQTGKSVPNIVDLIRIAEYFHVSADYLLGLSDTVTPDVSARAAVAYTGLSEVAVERLHIGLDDFVCDGEGISEDEKKWNLGIASALIQSETFTDIVHRLGRISEESYWEKVLQILESEYSEGGYASKERRDYVETTLISVLEKTDPFWDGLMPMVLHGLDDDNLAGAVFNKLMSVRDTNELQQFHATKALTRYLDKLVEKSQNKAQERFKPK